MAKTRAPSILGDEVAILLGAFLPDVAPPVASSTAARRSAATAVATTAGTSGGAAISSAAGTSTLAAAPAAAMALGPTAITATTSSRTTPAAAFARAERLVGRPGRPLRPLLLGQGGSQRADHTDDLGPVEVLHHLQRRLDMAIFIMQRASKTRVQGGVRGSIPFATIWLFVSSSACSASMGLLLGGMVKS